MSLAPPPARVIEGRNRNSESEKKQLKDEEMSEQNGAEAKEEQEEALVALIEHRTKEVEHLQKRISYYKSQLEQAEKRLKDSESKLTRLRRGENTTVTAALDNGHKKVKEERRSSSPVQTTEIAPKSRSHSRPELLIPSVKPTISQTVKIEPDLKASTSSAAQTSSSHPVHSHRVEKSKGEKHSRDQEATEVRDKGTKRKFEQNDKKEHKELVPFVRSCSSADLIRCYSSSLISSQHKRKLRSLALCPGNDQLFVTSALDGFVNLWKIQSRGSSASLLSSTECMSPKQRRWPEDITWNPEGSSLFSAYSADGGDSQISVLNLNSRKERARVTFLEEKPHVKGIINSIVFMPWDTSCFVTGGSDHAVISWIGKDEENSWTPKTLHRNLHSSAVMGVAGMQQKQIVLSVGADKRIFGFDVVTGRADFKHQIESKCLSVLPNPRDFNLFMVQTGAHEKQLRLFDIRLRREELHAFGWTQESSESQSALVNQAWSSNGIYITSGSADPIIHVFDIRYNGQKPSQSVKAHHKRVFKAAWHHSLPLLVSISSDLNIGLHKIAY